MKLKNYLYKNSSKQLRAVPEVVQRVKVMLPFYGKDFRKALLQDSRISALVERANEATRVGTSTLIGHKEKLGEKAIALGEHLKLRFATVIKLNPILFKDGLRGVGRVAPKKSASKRVRVSRRK